MPLAAEKRPGRGAGLPASSIGPDNCFTALVFLMNTLQNREKEILRGSFCQVSFEVTILEHSLVESLLRSGCSVICASSGSAAGELVADD
jgi:hypothetical protein